MHALASIPNLVTEIVSEKTYLSPKAIDRLIAKGLGTGPPAPEAT